MNAEQICAEINNLFQEHKAAVFFSLKRLKHLTTFPLHICRLNSTLEEPNVSEPCHPLFKSIQTNEKLQF